MVYLFDSVILIDHFNGIDQATQFIRDHHDQAVISVISRAELLVGFDDASLRLALSLLNQFSQLEITVEVADLAAKLRRQYRWKLPDAFQAALALHHDLKLVTRNTRDFDPDEHDFVWVPYQLSK